MLQLSLQMHLGNFFSYQSSVVIHRTCGIISLNIYSVSYGRGVVLRPYSMLA